MFLFYFLSEICFSRNEANYNSLISYTYFVVKINFTWAQLWNMFIPAVNFWWFRSMYSTVVFSVIYIIVYTVWGSMWSTAFQLFCKGDKNNKIWLWGWSILTATATVTLWIIISFSVVGLTFTRTMSPHIANHTIVHHVRLASPTYRHPTNAMSRSCLKSQGYLCWATRRSEGYCLSITTSFTTSYAIIQYNTISKVL